MLVTVGKQEHHYFRDRPATEPSSTGPWKRPDRPKKYSTQLIVFMGPLLVPNVFPDSAATPRRPRSPQLPLSTMPLITNDGLGETTMKPWEPSKSKGNPIGNHFCNTNRVLTAFLCINRVHYSSFPGRSDAFWRSDECTW